MRHILWAASATVGRKNTRYKIFLFRDPKIDHRFGTKGAGGPAPDIFSLRWSPWNIGGVFESTGAGKMVGPRLRAPRQIIVPPQQRHAGKGPFAVVAFEQAVVEAAKARLGTGKQTRCQSEKG